MKDEPQELLFETYENGQPCKNEMCLILTGCLVCKRLNAKGKVTVVEKKRPEDES